MPSTPEKSISRQRLESLFSAERLSTYLAQCEGDFRQPEDRYEDLLALSGYIEPALPSWIEGTSTVAGALGTEVVKPGSGSW